MARRVDSPPVPSNADRATHTRRRLRACRRLEHLRTIDGPVVFASNHLSHLDVPVILAAMPGRWRARVAPAMLKEFFEAHFIRANTHGSSGSRIR